MGYVASDPKNRTSGNLFVGDVEKFVSNMREAAAAALGPARSLVDGSRARAIATQLQSEFLAVATLSQDALAERARIEANSSIKPEVLRGQWAAFRDEVTSQAKALYAQIKTHVDEYTTALEQEALPVTTDPASALLARGEVEAALRVESGVSGFVKLASRGGDVAAAVASPWGRSLFEAATGDSSHFELVQAEASRTALTSEDAVRRRAAEALVATRTPRPGRRDQVQSLSEAVSFAVAILSDVQALVKSGVVIK